MDTIHKSPKELLIESSARDRPEWGLGSRIAFRFIFLYFCFSAIPFPLSGLPWMSWINEWHTRLDNHVVLWIGTTILGVEGPINTQFNGSGDRTYDYIQMFGFLLFATIATAIWSIADRRRRQYSWLCQALRVYLRVLVGITMLSYGFAKVFRGGQFLEPDTGQLLNSYGDSSPMNLLWTFMGASRPYTVFAGLMEVAPGILLLFRRTANLGALILLGVIGNIVVLNFCYDVPVKLYSSHLWLMTLFIAAPAIHQVFSLLVLSAPVPSKVSWDFFTSSRARIIARCIFGVIVAGLVFEAVYPQWQVHRSYRRSSEFPIRGAFHIDEMTVNARTPSPLETSRWKRIWVRRRGVRVYRADGTSEYYRSKSEIKGPMTLDLSRWDDSTNERRALLEIRQEDGTYVVEGMFEGAQIRARLKRIDTSDSLLMKRGFHWISEAPFNR